MMEENHENLQSEARNAAPDERRSAPRFPVSVPIHWHLREDKSGHWNEGRLIDLSIGGAAISAEEKLEQDTAISLKLPAPVKSANEADDDGPKKRPLTVSGKTVNSCELEDGSWRYGVQFEKILYVLADWMPGLAEKSGDNPDDITPK